LDADKRRLSRFLNYLKATDIEVGLLINFGAKPEVKRISIVQKVSHGSFFVIFPLLKIKCSI